ncbi:MAG: sulfide-dependent adenosine diphosphate thiazole synthase [Armatimonadota bacterium]
MSEKQVVTFASATEAQVTRLLVREFMDWFDECIDADVLIAGGGPSGLMCGRLLAQRGVKVVVVERNNYLGGGFWMGGFLMNKAVVRRPADSVLAELGVPFKEVDSGLVVADGPHACSRLISAACDAGVRILNMTSVDDVVVREDNRVAGLVINWSPVYSLPREISCVDPVAIESRVVVDATGHDAVVARHLADRGLISLPGCHPMWIERSEDEVVRHTGFVHPGLVVVGMSVASVYGLPRMGPSFGAMLLSGIKGAEIILEHLKG